jgi:hypothetical protein
MTTDLVPFEIVKVIILLSKKYKVSLFLNGGIAIAVIVVTLVIYHVMFVIVVIIAHIVSMCTQDIFNIRNTGYPGTAV